MAILEQEIEEVQGFNKEIDPGAVSAILDNLQRYQYAHPQKSAIRELVSNGLDAIVERDIALKILAGQAKAEDFFITRNDAANRDSNFDEKYYDPSWLWHEENFLGPSGLSPDTVYITYEEIGETEKDRIIIEDFGVGLGGARLEGYFKIGLTRKFSISAA